MGSPQLLPLCPFTLSMDTDQTSSGLMATSTVMVTSNTVSQNAGNKHLQPGHLLFPFDEQNCTLTSALSSTQVSENHMLKEKERV